MLFNSFTFIVFLCAVFPLYWGWAAKNRHRRNVLVLLASYVFYGWWDWRFLSLIAISSMIDFWVGLQLEKTDTPRTRKGFLWLSLAVNLGFLGFFKYFNFFSDNLSLLLNSIGLETHPASLNIILPVGISFYTFQTLSYTIDIYRRDMQAVKDPIAFFAYVAFFPQLVAGPIERAAKLLPQFEHLPSFDPVKATDGMRQILWGLFKKVVVADTAAAYVDVAFTQTETVPAGSLLLGAILFAFQIYGDFSGYSDIAIGTARLFGFELMTNFRYPYFSRDIAEFWRRWHISLSTWFRDYLYIPLGGSRGGRNMQIRNTMAIFLVSGFWHGANWTFIFWGALNALYFLPLLLAGQNRRNLDVVAAGRFFPTIRETFQMLGTFFITVVAWIFFRAPDLGAAFGYLREMADPDLLQIQLQALTAFPFIVILLMGEWLNRDKEYALAAMPASKFLRWSIYLFLAFMILEHWGSPQSFIYFQF
ncbi:MAG: MBOAT family O-acyltransferase [Bacteroidota bacterium]